MRLVLSLLLKLGRPGTCPPCSRSFARPTKSAPIGFIFSCSNCIVERAFSGDTCSIDVHHPVIEHVAPADSTLFEQRREPTPDRRILGVDGGGGVGANALHGVHAENKSDSAPLEIFREWIGEEAQSYREPLELG